MPDDKLRAQFGVLESGLYFNHAAIAPWPRCAAQAVQDFAVENAGRGPVAYARWTGRERELRARLARLTGAGHADDIALLKNTSEGISLVAAGLEWQAGDSVVLPAGEFPSNRLPWLALRALGVQLREVDIRAAKDAEAALLEAVDASTRLLSVSAVQWADGFRLDLARLGEACRRRHVLFFVDAIQQLGALPLDVEACHIDFLAADAHKWLLGPEGIAVFYSRPEVRPLLTLRQHGWHMFDDPFVFERDDWTPAGSALRFEAGSPNSLGQAAMHASLGVLLDQGMQRVAAQVLENTRALLEGLAAFPAVRVLSPSEPSRRSGIVTFASKSHTDSELHRALKIGGVVCARRGGGIRLSPHFYQGEKEIAEFFEVLAGVVQE